MRASSSSAFGVSENSSLANAARRDFPILEQSIGKNPLIYLDSAASAQKPSAVIDAMTAYYHSDNANVHRGAHTLGDRATASFEGARDKVRAFLNAREREEIIWTKGTTEAINLVANGLADRLSEGDEIIVTRMEHHANIVPWQMLAERTGAVVKVWEINQAGELISNGFEQLLSAKTRILACTHVSNVLGTINPVKDMIAKARAAEVITVIDGAQATPHFSVDVQDLDCDFYAFSSHKLFGPTGIGVLYGKREQLEAMPPYQGGGEMIERVSFEGTTFNKLPYKFEAGTPAIGESVGLASAIDYLNSHDRLALEKHENELLENALFRSTEVVLLIVSLLSRDVSVNSYQYLS